MKGATSGAWSWNGRDCAEREQDRHMDVRLGDPAAVMAGDGVPCSDRRDPCHTRHGGTNHVRIPTWSRSVAHTKVHPKIGRMATAHPRMRIHKHHQTRSEVSERSQGIQVLGLLSKSLQDLRLHQQQTGGVLSHGSQVQRQDVRSGWSTLHDEEGLPEIEVVAGRSDGRIRELVGRSGRNHFRHPHRRMEGS